jgi:hypothetical protein
MDKELFQRVWGYKRFTELTPLAAKTAIQNTQLFSQDTPWGKCMDPVTDQHLYWPDGQLVKLSVKEREFSFPKT